MIFYLTDYLPVHADAIIEPFIEESQTRNKQQLLFIGIGLLLLIIIIFIIIKRRKQKDVDKNNPFIQNTTTTRQLIEKKHFSSIGSIQDVGKRENQQDALGISQVQKHFNRIDQLYIIADGMGGLQNGQAAAQMTVNCMLNSFYSKNYSSNQIPTILENWINNANNQVNQSYKGKAGTTLVCVWISNNSLFWVSIGDSPFYLLRQERLYKINESQNRIKDLYLDYMHEEISAEELINSDQKANLTSNIGRETPLEYDCNYYPFEIKPGDKFLLCTDGVSGFLDNTDIINALQLPDAQQCCDQLSNKLVEKDNPQQDNYSAIAIFF